MRLLIDTSTVAFTVSREVQLRNGDKGVHRMERTTHVPMRTVQLVTTDEWFKR
jgi:hypothetical protein